MRTITTTVYKYNELSDAAKEKAREWYLGDGWEYSWAKENEDTLRAFEAIFPVKVGDWQYGSQNYINFRMTCDDDISELTGWRLATYLWNNYRDRLYKGKYYSTKGYYDDAHKYHYTCRHSNIILEHSCVLTGFAVDDDILDPVYKFLAKPTDRVTFKELMYDCLQSWVYACRDDWEGQQEDEAVTEVIEANEYEFTEDGHIA